jgi:hypothetical protein
MSATRTVSVFVHGAVVGAVLYIAPVVIRAHSPGPDTWSQRTVARRAGTTDQQETDWRFPASEVRALELTNYSGDMLLRRSPHAELRITATKHGASKNELDKVVIDLKQQGGRVVGTVDYLAEFSTAAVSFLVEAPPGLSVELNSSSGGIRAEGFEGNLTAETGSGTIALSDVGGEVHATTGSGDIHADCTQQLRQVGPPTSLAEARGKWSSRLVRNDQGGNIVIRPGHRNGGGSPPRTLTSSSGTVTLHLAEQIGADLLVEALSQRFTSEFREIKQSDLDARDN